MSKKISVCVFCGSRFGNNPEFSDAARNLGTYIGRNGYRMVFGGGNSGLMGLTSQAALAAGGEVIGITPKILLTRETPLDNLTEIHIVENMHERKQMMSDLADIFVVLPGGIGTFEEAFEMLTSNWIGAVNKPVGFLDVDDFYNGLFRFADHAAKCGFIAPECRALMHLGTEPAALIDKLIEAIDG